jgi:hypothetical protein
MATHLEADWSPTAAINQLRCSTHDIAKLFPPTTPPASLFLTRPGLLRSAEAN